MIVTLSIIVNIFISILVWGSSAFWIFPETLTNDDFILHNPATLTGSFSGGNMVLINDKILFQGSDGIASANLDFSDGHLIDISPKITMINDLEERKVFLLATSSIVPISSPEFVKYIIPVSLTNGIDYSNAIELSEEIFVGFGSGIFHGHGFAYVADVESETGHRIDLVTGTVDEIDYPTQYWQSPSLWTVFGMYDTINEDIIYPTPAGLLQRQNIFSVNDFSDKLSNSTFGTATSFMLDSKLNNWYVFYEEETDFGGFTNFLARANINPIAPTSQPSSIPSTSPSSFPTSSPSISLSAPKILSLTSASLSSTNVELSILIDANSRFAGSISCKAFSNTSFSPSTSSIINGGVTSSFAANQDQISIQISFLEPLTSYNLFCYTTNVLGYKSSLSDVLGTKTTIQTPCCYSVSFTNAPSIVYSDLSRYTSNDLSSSFVYSFSLSHPPKYPMIIQPQIYSSGNSRISSQLLSIFPSFFEFSATSDTLDGSFHLWYFFYINHEGVISHFECNRS